MASIIHPGMLAALSDFFPSTCTIQQNTPEQDAYGEPIADWDDLAGHVDIPCQISPAGGREVKLANQTYAVASHAIALQGSYTTITPAMRVTSGGATYDILAVESDSQGVMTRLLCQVVS
jgi:head-tail adaptor